MNGEGNSGCCCCPLDRVLHWCLRAHLALGLCLLSTGWAPSFCGLIPGAVGVVIGIVGLPHTATPAAFVKSRKTCGVTPMAAFRVVNHLLVALLFSCCVTVGVCLFILLLYSKDKSHRHVQKLLVLAAHLSDRQQAQELSFLFTCCTCAISTVFIFIASWCRWNLESIVRKVCYDVALTRIRITAASTAHTNSQASNTSSVLDPGSERASLMHTGGDVDDVYGFGNSLRMDYDHEEGNGEGSGAGGMREGGGSGLASSARGNDLLSHRKFDLAGRLSTAVGSHRHMSGTSGAAQQSHGIEMSRFLPGQDREPQQYRGATNALTNLPQVEHPLPEQQHISNTPSPAHSLIKNSPAAVSPATCTGAASRSPQPPPSTASLSIAGMGSGSPNPCEQVGESFDEFLGYY